MATIRAYTTIEQSHKLAEILPLESADMSYSIIHNIGQEPYHCNVPMFAHATHGDIPCWSLAPLLNILPKIHKLKPILDLEENSIQYSGIDLYIVADNPVDACYEMILKLYELKML